MAKSYQTKEGKKKVMNFTLKGIEVLSLLLIVVIFLLIAYHEKNKSYINVMFFLITWIVLYEGLFINFIHKHWDQSINIGEDSDPVDSYFKSKK